MLFCSKSPQTSFNQFSNKREQALRADCPNIYIVLRGNKRKGFQQNRTTDCATSFCCVGCGVIQQPRGSNFTHFWPPTPSSGLFCTFWYYTYVPFVNVTKRGLFTNHLLLHTSYCPRSYWMTPVSNRKLIVCANTVRFFIWTFTVVGHQKFHQSTLGLYFFSKLSSRFLNPVQIIFSNLNYNCSNVLDLRNLQEIF